jgi:predicted ribosomally synthesized peptide with nif11-like leader
MSLESAKAFLEKIRHDEQFRKHCSNAASHEERFKLLKAAGFDFTTAELDQVSGELSPEELDQVVGGTVLVFLAPPPPTRSDY